MRVTGDGIIIQHSLDTYHRDSPLRSILNLVRIARLGALTHTAGSLGGQERKTIKA
jgi:hypothetical protein